MFTAALFTIYQKVQRVQTSISRWMDKEFVVGGGGKKEMVGQMERKHRNIYTVMYKIASGNLLCDSGNSNSGSVTT